MNMATWFATRKTRTKPKGPPATCNMESRIYATEVWRLNLNLGSASHAVVPESADRNGVNQIEDPRSGASSQPIDPHIHFEATLRHAPSRPSQCRHWQS